MNQTHRVPMAIFEPSTWVELLRCRAYYHPGHRVFTYLTDGESEEEHLTYGELDRKACVIAALIQDRVSPGEHVLLLYPPGLDLIAGYFGCLYAGAVAVPAYPHDLSRQDEALPRLRALVEHTKAKAVLTNAFTLALAKPVFDQALELGGPIWIVTDVVPDGIEYGWHEPKLSRDTPAFLKDGWSSTGLLKSATLSHGDLLQETALLASALPVGSCDINLALLPLYHSLGLTGGVLLSLYCGIPCILISSYDFLDRPFLWLQAISRYHATISGGTDLVYDLCVRKITAEQKASLDLSAWSLAYSGTEPGHVEMMDRFSREFAICGFRKEAFYVFDGVQEAILPLSAMI